MRSPTSAATLPGFTGGGPDEPLRVLGHNCKTARGSSARCMMRYKGGERQGAIIISSGHIFL